MFAIAREQARRDEEVARLRESERKLRSMLRDAHGVLSHLLKAEGELRRKLQSAQSEAESADMLAQAHNIEYLRNVAALFLSKARAARVARAESFLSSARSRVARPVRASVPISTWQVYGDAEEGEHVQLARVLASLLHFTTEQVWVVRICTGLPDGCIISLAHSPHVRTARGPRRADRGLPRGERHKRAPDVGGHRRAAREPVRLVLVERHRCDTAALGYATAAAPWRAAAGRRARRAGPPRAHLRPAHAARGRHAPGARRLRRRGTVEVGSRPAVTEAYYYYAKTLILRVTATGPPLGLLCINA